MILTKGIPCSPWKMRKTCKMKSFCIIYTVLPHKEISAINLLLKKINPEKYSPLTNFHTCQISPLKNIHNWKIFTPKIYSPLNKYRSLKTSRPWKIFTPQKYSRLKNNHPWKIFTPAKNQPQKNIHPWKIHLHSNIFFLAVPGLDHIYSDKYKGARVLG